SQARFQNEIPRSREKFHIPRRASGTQPPRGATPPRRTAPLPRSAAGPARRRRQGWRAEASAGARSVCFSLQPILAATCATLRRGDKDEERGQEPRRTIDLNDESPTLTSDRTSRPRGRAEAAAGDRHCRQDRWPIPSVPETTQGATTRWVIVLRVEW